MLLIYATFTLIYMYQCNSLRFTVINVDGHYWHTKHSSSGVLHTTHLPKKTKQKNPTKNNLAASLARVRRERDLVLDHKQTALKLI